MTPDPPDTAPLLRPAPIVKGDAIGIVAPSYAPRPGWLLHGVKALEHAGYSVVLDPEIATGRRFKRLEDERRAPIDLQDELGIEGNRIGSGRCRGRQHRLDD